MCEKECKGGCSGQSCGGVAEKANRYTCRSRTVEGPHYFDGPALLHFDGTQAGTLFISPLNPTVAAANPDAEAFSIPLGGYIPRAGHYYFFYDSATDGIFVSVKMCPHPIVAPFGVAIVGAGGLAVTNDYDSEDALTELGVVANARLVALNNTGAACTRLRAANPANAADDETLARSLSTSATLRAHDTTKAASSRLVPLTARDTALTPSIPAGITGIVAQSVALIWDTAAGAISTLTGSTNFTSRGLGAIRPADVWAIPVWNDGTNLLDSLGHRSTRTTTLNPAAGAVLATLDCENLTHKSGYAVATGGAAVCTVRAEISMDNVNWFSLGNIVAGAASGIMTSAMLDQAKGFRYIRLVNVVDLAASGTTVEAVLSAQQ